MNNLDLNTILVGLAVLAVGLYLWRKHQAANAPPPADWFAPPPAPAAPQGPQTVYLQAPLPDVGLEVFRTIRKAQEIGQARRIEAALQNGPPSPELTTFANTLLGTAQPAPQPPPAAAQATAGN